MGARKLRHCRSGRRRTPCTTVLTMDAVVKKLAAAIQGATAADRNELVQKVLDSMAALESPHRGA